MQYRSDTYGNQLSILGFGCMPCPKNVDIPGTFAACNRRYQGGNSGPLWTM